MEEKVFDLLHTCFPPTNPTPPSHQLRKPKLLLMDEGDAYADALGPEFLRATLEHLAANGTGILVTAYHSTAFGWIPDVYEMRHGRPWPVVATK